MSYSGSCHCGAVAFTVDADIPDKAISCNCSHCHRKGFILTAVPGDKMRIDSGADTLTHYHFNTGKIDHGFCATCGCQPFSSGKGRDGKASYMINLRCVPDADLDAITIEQYDGKSH
jgi:hypothetical protein